MASGTNLAGEHQIEWDRVRQSISCVWCLDLIFPNALIQLLGVVVLAVLLYLLVPCFLFRLYLVAFLLYDLLYCFVNQLVRPVALSVLHIFHHEIFEFVNVTLQKIRSKVYEKKRVDRYLLMFSKRH